MKYAVEERFTAEVPPGVVVQGELFGPSIQANRLGVDGVRYAVFAVWRDGAQLPRPRWPRWATDRAAPVYELRLPRTVDDAVTQADGIESPSLPVTLPRASCGIATTRYRWRRSTAGACFKAISNRWLLRESGGGKRKRGRRS